MITKFHTNSLHQYIDPISNHVKASKIITPQKIEVKDKKLKLKSRHCMGTGYKGSIIPFWHFQIHALFPLDANATDPVPF